VRLLSPNYEKKYKQLGLDSYMEGNYMAYKDKLTIEEQTILRQELSENLYQNTVQIVHFIWKRFGKKYTCQGVVPLLHRLGFSYQKQEQIVVPLISVSLPILSEFGVRLSILREDLIHPYISGNKWRKLKYNLWEAKRLQYDTLLTFGGAYSNHIRAVACAGKELGFRTIGIIRGEETLPLNSSLLYAKNMGMQIYYLDRTTYRQKNNQALIAQFHKQFGDFYLIPEGGTNLLAVKGCTEIWQNIPDDVDLVCCACGTGGTIAGIIAGAPSGATIWGFPVLKGGEFLYNDIQNLLQQYQPFPISDVSWKLITDYHFGGYAKKSTLLTKFIEDFIAQTQIPIEFVYTGKMLYGIFDLISTQKIPKNTHIVAVHTGGIFN